MSNLTETNSTSEFTVQLFQSLKSCISSLKKKKKKGKENMFIIEVKQFLRFLCWKNKTLAILGVFVLVKMFLTYFHCQVIADTICRLQKYYSGGVVCDKSHCACHTTPNISVLEYSLYIQCV